MKSSCVRFGNWSMSSPRSWMGPEGRAFAARGWRTSIRRRTGTQLIMVARQRAIVEELRRRHVEAQRTDIVS